MVFTVTNWSPYIAREVSSGQDGEQQKGKQKKKQTNK